MGRTQMTHTLKQKIALAVALAVAVALVFVSVVAGVAIYAMSSGESNYGENEYPRSAQSYGIGTRVIPEQLDQWEAYFGQGTAEIRADAVDAGVDTLAVALERVPKDADSDEPEPTGAEKLEDFTPECRVRINLAVGQEILGDRLYAAGYFDEARATFEGASATVAQCVPQGEPPKQQKQDTDDKAKDAQEQQQAQGNDGDPKTPPDGEEPTDGDPPPSTGDLKSDELKRRAEEAERLSREAQQRDGEFGDWNGENW